MRLTTCLALILLVFLLCSCAKPPEYSKSGDIAIAIPDATESSIQPTITPTLPELSTSEYNIQCVSNSHGSFISKSITIDSTYSIEINGYVNCANVERISAYRYIPTDITEDERISLFNAYFKGQANELYQNTLGYSAGWILEEDGIKKYTFNYGRGSGTIDENLFVLRNTTLEKDLYMLNSIEATGLSLSDAYEKCEEIIPSLVQDTEYAPDLVQPFNMKEGLDGTCLLILYRRLLDGIPVTANYDLRFIVTNNEIFKLTGTLYDTVEIPLSQYVLSAEDAVESLAKYSSLISTSSLNIEEIGLTSIPISEITFEYIVRKGYDFTYEITPVWRFQIGYTEQDRIMYRDRIIAIDAITGEIISERRGIQC